MESWNEYVEVVYYVDWITPAEMCAEVKDSLWSQLPFLDSDYEEAEMSLRNTTPFQFSEEVKEGDPVPADLFDLVDMMASDKEDEPTSRQEAILEEIGIGGTCCEDSDKVMECIGDPTSDQDAILDQIGIGGTCCEDSDKVMECIGDPTSDQDAILDQIGIGGTCCEDSDKVKECIGDPTSDQDAILDQIGIGGTCCEDSAKVKECIGDGDPTSDQDAVLAEIGDSARNEEGGHPGNNDAQGQSSPLPKSLLSVKRGSNGKYFLESEYTGERSVEGSGQIVYKNGKFKINAAANMEIGKSSHTLIFQAGEVQVVIDISNEPKEVIQQKMKWLLRKELKKTVGPAQGPVPGSYYGARVVEQERLALQSSFIKCPVQITLKLKLNLNLSKFNLTRAVQFSYGGIEVYLLVTNVRPLFKPIVTKKLARKLNIPPSDLWTSDYSVSFQEEPKPEIEVVAVGSPCSTVKPLSKWGRLRRIFRSSKVSPMMDQ